MKQTPLSMRRFVTDLAASGRYCFTTQEFAGAHGTGLIAARAALRRLSRQGALAMPYRGFFVIVPPEYQALGCLPADQFVPDLMAHLGEPYYAGLLTAAQYHGAAHQAPLRFQVVTRRNRPDLVCGKVAVQFSAKVTAATVPVKTFNTRRGCLSVSTPEATAFDLVGYAHRCGGLDNVATVLAGLASQLNADALMAAAAAVPIAWAQRLGFLLQQVGQADRTGPLATFVAAAAPRIVPLSSGATVVGSVKDRTWQVAINTDVEPDL